MYTNAAFSLSPSSSVLKAATRKIKLFFLFHAPRGENKTEAVKSKLPLLAIVQRSAEWGREKNAFVLSSNVNSGSLTIA